MDPRPSIVERRFASIRRVLAVTGGKGGIGKSSVAVGLALASAADGARVGLLDLDLWGPSDHVILGVPRPGLREDGGLVPHATAGVALMSIASVAGDRAAVLRGDDISSSILELLAVTIWGDLDLLVVDMPPGFGDTLLDAARYLPFAEHVVVTTPSRLTLAVTRKMVEALDRLEMPIAGLVVNGVHGAAPAEVMREIEAVDWGAGLRPMGLIGHDPGYEASLGDPERLRRTAFYRDVTAVSRALAATARPAGTRR